MKYMRKQANISMKENSDFLSCLGLAKKAGKLVIGWDRIKEYNGNVDLLIISSDASEKVSVSANKSYKNVLVVSENMNEIGSALGINKTAFIAVTDSGFSNLLVNKYQK